jgi:hypothetical protein
LSVHGWIRSPSSLASLPPGRCRISKPLCITRPPRPFFLATSPSWQPAYVASPRMARRIGANRTSCYL